MDFMHRALDLAEQVAGGLAPRPPVGAVIVAADGKTIVGEGATQPSPGPHAEAVAIGIAGETARGGTIYCTLEPHQHRSTTPSCAQAIIDAEINRVVCPTIDPNPEVEGRGFERLRASGIEVVTDVDNSTAQRANVLIEGFAKHVTTGMPFVTAKWAMSLDGKIATHTGDSKWITGSEARAHAHNLRYRSDAIITGIGTVIADNPRLTARDPNSGERLANRPYIRVVVDSQAQLPTDAALLNEPGEVIQATIGFPPLAGKCGTQSNYGYDVTEGRRGPSASGLPPLAGEMPEGQRGREPHHTITLPTNDNKTVDLRALIHHLGNRGCHNVLIEAGEKLTGALFDLKLIDKVVAYIATDKIIGGHDAMSPIGGIGPASMQNIAHLTNTRVETVGNHIAVTGYVEYPQESDQCSAA